MKRLLSIVVVLSAMLSAAPTRADSLDVLEQRRIGNNLEDIEYIETGPLANSIVAMDGLDVRVLGATGNGRSEARTLFNLRDAGVPLGWAPRGIAWVESRHALVVVNFAPATESGWEIVFIDLAGHVVGRGPMVPPAGMSVDHVEAVQYFGMDGKFFPDHLAAVVYDFSSPNLSHIVVMTLDGIVVHDITVGEPISSAGVLGMTYAPKQDRLLVSASTFPEVGAQIAAIDRSGTVTGTARLSGSLTIEGLAVLPSGRIAAGVYEDGSILLFDEQMQRSPEGDRSFFVTPGVSRPLSVSWDARRDRYLFLGPNGVDSVPSDVSSKAKLLGQQTIGATLSMDYVGPKDHLAVLKFARPQRIRFFDMANGAELLESLDLSALFPPPRRAQFITYVASTDQFVVQLRAFGPMADEGRRLHFVNADGTYDRAVTLERRVGAVTWQPGEGNGRLVANAFDNDTLLVLGLDGSVLETHPAPPLFLNDIAAVTTGPFAGTIAGVEAETSSFARLALTS